MSSGSRQILEYAPELEIGVTPTPFARQVLGFTEVTLDSAVTKEDSNTIIGNRLASKGMITGVDYTGDINAEAKFGDYDQLIEAAAFNKFEVGVPAVGSDTLTFGGSVRQTFSILRGYEDIANYHTFSGVHVNTFNLDIPEQGIVTFGFGLMGKNRVVANGAAPAGTVVNASDNPSLSNVSVGQILLDGVSQAGTACVSAFSFAWDNSMQVQRCLGLGLEIGAIIETLANGTGSFTAAWSTGSALNYEKQFTNTTISLVIPFTDTEGNEYELTLPEVEITGSLPSGGNSDLLQATFEYRVVEQAPTLVRTPFTP